MKKFDYNGSVLAKMQGNLFSQYSEYEKCSPLIFIRRFMNSELALRFDNIFILKEASSIDSLVEELDEEYGPTSFGDPNLYSKEALYWTGYILRYWCYVCDLLSKELIKLINVKKIIERYPMYHTMDPEYAIQTIVEEDNIVIPKHRNIDEIFAEYFEYLEQK